MALSTFGRKMFSYKGLTLMTAPVAVLVAAGTVMGASANLNAQTSSDGNTWKTPAALSLSLVNDNGSAMFAATDIAPGYSESHCITITNDSPVAVTLKSYSAGFASNPLSDAMNVGIIAGSGGTDTGDSGSGDHCSGFTPDAVTPTVFSGTMSSFATKTDFATGVGAKSLAPGESVQYKVTADLPGAVDAAAVEEQTATLDFKWEIQN